MKDRSIGRRSLLTGIALAVGLALFGLGLPPQRTAALGPAAAHAEEPKRPWYDLGLGLDDIQENQALFLLGLTYAGQADIGEVLDTATRITADDEFSWYKEWLKTADRLNSAAQKGEAAGHKLSAGETYMRAATYYRAALMHYPNTKDPAIAQVAQKGLDAYEKAITLMGLPVQKVEIPYEGTTLPGYFWRSPVAKDKAPILIAFQGRDGSPEDTKYLADQAMKRGYHFLTFAGPGQGVTLRQKGLPFRPDWEKVITPVVDFAIAQPGVDPERIALMGHSMGGFLAPRAAAFEPRIKALIANPGYVNWYDTIVGYFAANAPDLLKLLESDPKGFDAVVAQAMTADPLMKWGFDDMAWKHGATSPSDLMAKLKEYNLEPYVDQIKARTLVMDSEAEAFGAGQAKKLYDALKSPKEYTLFTAEDTGLLHNQPGALGVSSQRVFDWLDENI